MATDWRAIAARSKYPPSAGRVVVVLGDGRRQTLELQETDAGLVVRTIVAPARELPRPAELSAYLGERNRETDLIGYRLDARGRLIAELLIHPEGLSRAEWELLVHHLAATADRQEAIISGLDEY